ncbi:uncharacterized protein METZ01_LOCUS113060 [marine metagenome]|uniref:Uncharacterized protein n=1 Tax=marine metagenome TaxID=408172 RepID=A0A381X624_9ZZZZ
MCGIYGITEKNYNVINYILVYLIIIKIISSKLNITS